ncbi:TadE/TadG family type IV pilus assembly protein [Brevundimonas subvibrioides]|uniref:TadE family protein n=1 Tax=Brevundimonas subvibrioides (strain ATCC 15264 / DSM 4735 / LMG 14903 / NBRC 16000 / CB 81) TaxID=633149 RepID=D9QLA7_BRESC|nr:TadE/TadG family type IV pilus assembly protein [Brevundimonas subvibrioides]ADK99962.1 TadE family protein [Brevundimonas subvibrioides ATCC 15264]
MIARARVGLRRFWRDESGVSAVEFALLAPVMIALYFGSAEFCQGFMAQKRMDHATSQVADITSQDGVVTRDELDDTLAVAQLIMSPFPTTPLKMRVSGVTRNASGVAKIDWSRGSGMTALGTGAVVTVPAGMIANGESVILSEATYDYVSPLRYLLPNAIQFRQTFYLRPRLVDKVTCSDC